MGFCQCQKNVDVITTQDQAPQAISSTNKGDDLPVSGQKDAKIIDPSGNNETADDTESYKLPVTSSSSDGDDKNNEAWENLAITLPLDTGVQPVSSEHSATSNLLPPASPVVDNIWDACERGKLDKVKEFITQDPSLIMKPSPPNDSDLESSSQQTTARTPLYYASLGGHLDIMKFLMDNGARDDDGGCYLAVSSSEGRRLLLLRERNSVRDMNSCESSQETDERSENDQYVMNDQGGMLSRIVSCCGPMPLDD